MVTMTLCNEKQGECGITPNLATGPHTQRKAKKKLFTQESRDYVFTFSCQSWVSAGRNLFLPDMRFKPD